MIKLVVATDKHKEWLSEYAAIRMLIEEVERPELVNKSQIRTLVEQGISQETVLIAEKDGNPVGVIAGLLVPNLFNPDIKVLAEIFWYVEPQHRKSRAGYLLLKGFDDLAKNSASEATMSILLHSEVRIEALEKLGFKMKEFAFHKRY